MKHLKYILTAICILSCVSAQAAVDVETILKERARAGKLPPTDSAILYHGTTITVHEDGRLDREEHIIRFLRTDNAWDDYGDPHLVYDAARQELEVPVSRTHAADGRKIDTTPNGFNPIVPFGLDQTPEFTHYRQMVVTHLGIDYDGVTEIRYVIRDTKPFYPFAWGEILFGGNEPILHRVVTIQAPIGIRLQVKTEGGAPEPIRGPVSGNDKLESFVCEMKDLPATNLSEAGAHPSSSLPRISFSSCQDWKTFTGEINKRIAAAMKVNSALAGDLESFAGIADAQQKLDSLLTFVSHRLAVKKYDDLSFLLDFRPVDKTYGTGYGSPADLAALYASALEVLGFKPEVYIVCRRGLPVPAIHGQEKLFIALGVDGKEAWLDPADHKLSFRSKRARHLIGIYPAQEPRMLKVSLPVESVARIVMGITFKDDKTAEGWMNVRATGRLSDYDQARVQNPKEYIEHWTSDLHVAPEVNNAITSALEILRVAAKADLKFAAPEKMQNGMLRYDIPWTASDVEGLIPSGLMLNYATRDLPLYLMLIGAFEVQLQISYPDGWDPAIIPEAVAVGAPGISLTRSVEKSAHQLTVNEKLEFTSDVVQPADWNAWRKVLLAANQASARAILFEINKEEGK
jgi:hypothetical protein